MVINSTEVKALKTNRIACLDLEVDKNYKIEFFIQKDDVIEKTLKLSLTPDAVCAAYIVSVDWANENVSCLKDNIDPTHIHLKPDVNKKCFIYDAKTFSLHHSIDAPYEYYEDFNEYGLAKVRYQMAPPNSGASYYHYGLIDKNCKIIIPLEYDTLEIYDGYIFASRTINNLVCSIYVLSLDGKVLLERKASFANKNNNDPRDHDGLIPIHDYANGFCYINLDNEIVIKPKYAGSRFGDRLFISDIGDRGKMHSGVVDADGNIIISFSYGSIHPIKQSKNGEYIYIVYSKRDQSYIVVDSNEQQIIYGSFERVEFRDDIICLLRDDEWYFYNRNLELIAKYAEENVRLWQWIGINVNGRWLPFNKVVNY